VQLIHGKKLNGVFQKKPCKSRVFAKPDILSSGIYETDDYSGRVPTESHRSLDRVLGYVKICEETVVRMAARRRLDDDFICIQNGQR